MALDRGSEWPWIKTFREFHDFLFAVVFVVTLVVLFVRGILKAPPKFESDQMAREILSSFVNTVGAIVQAKLDRFRGKLPEIKPNSDKFGKITHPREQIDAIAKATVRFLCQSYGLSEGEVDITVLRRKGGGPWHFYFTHQNWKHSDPEKLMGFHSAAAQTILTGEPIFCPDKFLAAKKGVFFLSDRDKRRGPGSVFVYPATFEIPAGRVETVVSIVTYGHQLCDDHESQTVEITQAFLREISRRFEIELCLDSIKTAS